MSNYIKTVNFATKDALPSGNAAKVVKGTEIDTEYNNIATAVATKQDTSGLGVANGYAPLDSGAKVPYANMQTDFPRVGVANTFTALQTINSPLSVNGIANSSTIAVNGSATTGQSFGLTITAGTNASDQALLVQNRGATATFFGITGNGNMGFGNTVTNPTFTFAGTGTASFGGSISVTAGVGVGSAGVSTSGQFNGSGAGLTSIPAGQLTGSVPASVIGASATPTRWLFLSGTTPTWAQIGFGDLLSGSQISNAQVPVGVLTQYAGSAEFRNISAKNGHAKTLQAGGTASGGADGDIIYIY